MGDEHDSWFKPFGFDPGKFAADALKTVENTVSTVAQEAKAVVQKAESVVSSAVTTAVKTVAKAVSPTGGQPASGAAGGGSAGSVSSLGGSVGQGGQNNPEDVKSVQAALNSKAGAGLAVDGKCGGATINAIKSFQKTMGQSNPDGRVDPGGATSRALAGGASGGSGPAPAPAGAPPPPATEADGAEGFFDGLKALGGKALKELDEGADAVLGAAKNLGGKVVQGVTNALDNPNLALSDLTSGPIGVPKLSLDRLSKEQKDAAQRFLTAHRLVAIFVSGVGDKPFDYQPVLDGKPSSIDQIVLALKAGIQALPLQNPAAGFKELVQERFNKLVNEAIKLAVQRNIDAVRSGAKVDPNVSREDAEKDLTAFLAKVLKAQGGTDLRVDEPVRLAGQAIARGLPGSDIAVATFLQGKSSPGTPAALARAVAKLLPPSIPRANVEALDRIPVKEAGSTVPQSFAGALAAGVIKEVDKLIKGLPKDVQDEIRKGVADAIEAGVVGMVELAMSDSGLDDTAKKEIKSIVGAAIKQNPNQPSLDRKQGTEGSPDARDRPPPLVPGPPEQPEIKDEQIFKTPEAKTPDGPPPKPKKPEATE